MTGVGPRPDVELPKSVLARGLLVLDAFSSADGELSLAALAARTGLPKPTAYRLASGLVEWGGLERTPSGYRLSMKLFELGQRVARPRDLRGAALPYLEDLYEATHENIHLAVQDEMHTFFLEKVTGHRSMPIMSGVGGRLPVHCTATGKLFLAYGSAGYFQRVAAAGLHRYTPRTTTMPGMLRKELDRVLERGYGVNHEECEVGVSAVAAPVFDRHKRLLAAISITGNGSKLDLDRLAPAVRTAAFAVSRELSRGRVSG
jgi:DNA-binding IclR family transcriptional regulator